jgi:murein DD-endopeptidase MepM/ murein hydrolase activator NlpD
MSFELTHVPVQPVRVTSKFGPRDTGLAGATTYHKGIDLGANKSLLETPVLAARMGTVVINQWNDTRGWYIVIEHESNDGEIFRTLYQHLREQSTKKINTFVAAGEIIGIMGASTKTIKGMSVHLHMEVQRLQNKAWTPVNFHNELLTLGKERHMTEEQVRAIIKEELAKSTDKPASWADAWSTATADGVTDGTKPQAYCTREQTIQFLYRGLGKAAKVK